MAAELTPVEAVALARSVIDKYGADADKPSVHLAKALLAGAHERDDLRQQIKALSGARTVPTPPATKRCTTCGAEDCHASIWQGSSDGPAEFFVQGYYGSKHDLDRYLFIAPKLPPIGPVCDACVDTFITTGIVEQVPGEFL